MSEIKEKTLLDYREELDVIDNELLNLISKRLDVISEVAKYKIKHNIPRYHPERELEMLEHKKVLARKIGLDVNVANDLMVLLLKHSHKLQKSMEVKE